MRLAYMQMEHRRRFRQDVAWNVAAVKWRVACFNAIVSLVSAATPSSRRRRSTPNSCCSTLSLCRNISFWKRQSENRYGIQGLTIKLANFHHGTIATILITDYIVPSKVVPFGSYTPILAPFPLFKTVLELLLWNGL